MRYDYIVLESGPELRRLESFTSMLPAVPVSAEPLVRYLSETALDIDHRWDKLLYLVAQLKDKTSEYLRPDQTSSFQSIVGRLGENLFYSVDQILGVNLLPAPGHRHLLSDYKYHALCERGVIMRRDEASLREPLLKTIREDMMERDRTHRFTAVRRMPRI